MRPDFTVRDSNLIFNVSGVRPLASALCNSDNIFVVTTSQNVFICVVVNNVIKVYSDAFKDIIIELRDALFDEQEFLLYSRMCLQCEHERYCYECSQHCDKYEDEYILLEEKYFGGEH